MSGDDISPEQLAELVEKIHRGVDPYPPLPPALVHEEAAGAAAAPPPSPADQGEPVKTTLYNLITHMTVGEKIKLALKGNRDARNILIRDANRIIPRFVLQNPRITEDEVSAISRNRNLDSDILRIIGDHKEWSKLPMVRSALVTNPKTPVAVALRFVSTLPERELRLLAKSKSVQSVVVGRAKRIVLQRQTGGRSTDL
ncbi:MAG TPA: hypothetical protein VMW17_15420 [Candidatus Binatia bacterium]|nr:hypothetical protein [Candidatus Binatia bacterium]